jgi:hypothetical protein
LQSYKFNKELDYEKRLHYVRGILYSRQFINEEDIYKYVNDLEIIDKRIIEKSLFDIRRFSDTYDKEFFENYMDNINIIDEEDITEAYLQGKELAVKMYILDQYGIPYDILSVEDKVNS